MSIFVIVLLVVAGCGCCSAITEVDRMLILVCSHNQDVRSEFRKCLDLAPLKAQEARQRCREEVAGQEFAKDDSKFVDFMCSNNARQNIEKIVECAKRERSKAVVCSLKITEKYNNDPAAQL